MIRNCNHCNKEYNAEPRYLKRNQGYYCSRKCAANGNISTRCKKRDNNIVVCAYCDKRFPKRLSAIKKSKSGLHFCCRQHKDLAQRLGGLKEIQPSHYGTSKVPEYRQKAFENFEHKCFDCGWNKHSTILEVHHKDEDRSNNSLENLVILCPTCHQVRHLNNNTGRYTKHGVMD